MEELKEVLKDALERIDQISSPSSSSSPPPPSSSSSDSSSGRVQPTQSYLRAQANFR